MEKEEEPALQLSELITMEELEEEEEVEVLEDEYENGVETPEPPIDRSSCECIEMIAAVVARTPAAELFLSQLMLGDKQFGFMFPDHEHHAYYWHRIAVLGRRPRLLHC